MELLLFFILLGLFSLIVSTYTDLRWREVPDILSYGLIASGILLRLAQSIISQDYSYLVFGILGLLTGFGLGYLMFMLGQWGGGDAKLLAGLFCLYAGPFSLVATLPWYGALGFYLLLIAVAGAAYTLVTMIVCSVLHHKKIRQNMRLLIRRHHKSFFAASIPGLLGIISSFVVRDPFGFLLLPLGFTWLVLPLLFVYSKAVESSCFIKRCPVSRLTEGDWVLDTITHKGTTIYAAKEKSISAEQIALCRKHGIKEVAVKEGIPFVPAFLIAFIVLLWRGEFLLLWFLSLII